MMLILVGIHTLLNIAFGALPIYGTCELASGANLFPPFRESVPLERDSFALWKMKAAETLQNRTEAAEAAEEKLQTAKTALLLVRQIITQETEANPARQRELNSMLQKAIREEHAREINAIDLRAKANAKWEETEFLGRLDQQSSSRLPAVLQRNAHTILLPRMLRDKAEITAELRASLDLILARDGRDPAEIGALLISPYRADLVAKTGTNAWGTARPGVKINDGTWRALLDEQPAMDDLREINLELRTLRQLTDFVFTLKVHQDGFFDGKFAIVLYDLTKLVPDAKYGRRYHFTTAKPDASVVYTILHGTRVDSPSRH